MFGKSLPFVLLAALATSPAATAQDAEKEAAEREREVTRIEIRQRMEEAEERLAAAAAQIAELSERNLETAGLARFEILTNDNRPRLGVSISGNEESGPVDGVEVTAVSPGSAAAEGGLVAGDVITAINDESFSAENSMTANRRLLEFMAGVEEGDKLRVEYQRDGKAGSVEVEPKTISNNVFAYSFSGDGNERVFSSQDFDVRVAPELRSGTFFPGLRGLAGTGWGSLELIELSEDLGRYFGTDEGLLVVSAPDDESLKLKDGDVIKEIDGRQPGSVGQALRILGTYEPGDEMELQIMRDKRRQKLKVEMPERRTSWIYRVPPAPAAPATMVPLQPAPAVVVPQSGQQVIIEERSSGT